MPAGPEVDSVPTPDAHVEEPTAQNSRDWNQVEALSPNFELSDAPEVHEHHEASHHDSAHHEDAHHEEHPHVDLTEEEAAALAEHIADAQDDDAARDAQNRVFAAADASAEAAESGLHEEHAATAITTITTPRNTRAKNTRKIPKTRSWNRKKRRPKKKA